MYTRYSAKKICAVLLLSCILVAQSTFAAMVSTDALLAEQEVLMARELIHLHLQREDLRDSFVLYGVDPDTAALRIAALSDSEILALKAEMDKAPAGGGVAELLVLILLFFVITDLLGLTDVFPFIHPAHSHLRAK